jgi:thiamine pyrophosphate-dependent acetolactate synthase large subunit-like protein
MKVNLKELFESSPNGDDKVMLKLLQAIAASQTSDFDYLRFKHSYHTLQQMGMDESTAAKSAFVTASTVGLTKDKLIDSVEQYKTILSKEREEFAHALKNQITNNIDARTVKVKELQDKHAQNIRKIEEITREQDLIASEINRLTLEAESALVKINETRDKFKGTYDHLNNEMQQDLLLYTNVL